MHDKNIPNMEQGLERQDDLDVDRFRCPTINEHTEAYSRHSFSFFPFLAHSVCPAQTMYTGERPGHVGGVGRAMVVIRRGLGSAARRRGFVSSGLP